MRRQWRQILPPPGYTILFFVVYMLTYLVDFYFHLLGLLVPEEVGMIRMPILILASASYGFYRVRVFHPSYNKKYWQWLCLSPWSINKPLPQGPVHLIWVDFVILTILTLLAYSNVPLEKFTPLVVFLFVYLAMIVLAFQAEQMVFTILFFFLFPFTFYPFKSINLAIIVFILLYALCYFGFYKSFRDFPWNTKYWKIDVVEELRKQAIRNNIIGWPFKHLNINKTFGISCFGAFILSFLLTWWLHVIRWAIDEPYNLKPLAILSVYVAVTRAFFYALKYRPPISLAGRIFTGRLIIPGYDKIFIAPICILLVGIPLPFALSFFGLNEVWSFEICFFLIFFLALSLPPKLNTWLLTGPYRISKFVQVFQPGQRTPQNQVLYDFFYAKFKSDS